HTVVPVDGNGPGQKPVGAFTFLDGPVGEQRRGKGSGPTDRPPQRGTGPVGPVVGGGQVGAGVGLLRQDTLGTVHLDTDLEEVVQGQQEGLSGTVQKFPHTVDRGFVTQDHGDGGVVALGDRSRGREG